MANTDYGAVLLTTCEATSQALNHRLGVSTGFKPSEWAENINLLVKPAEKSASGSVCHFTDGLDMPLVSLSCDVTAWQEGSGTASPSNPRAIHGWSSANVTRTGKNLLPPLSAEATSKSVTFTPRTDGGIDLSGTATGGIAVVDLGRSENLWLNAGTYFVNESTSLYSITVFDETSGTATVLKSGGGKFTITSRTKVFVRLGIPNGTATETAVYIQLELDSSATTFSQYTGTSLNIPFGQTVYGGRLNVMTGEMTITHAIVDMGSLAWIYNSSANVFWAVISDMKRPCTLLCEKYTQSSATNVENMVDYEIWNRGYAYNDKNIVAKDTNYATADAFKTAVTGVRLVYELATSTTITLTPHQMSSLLGENNIWADCGDSAVVYRGMVGDSFKCFFNSQVTSGWTGTSVERTMLTVKGNGNGSITFDNNGKGRTNCSNSDGYISVRKNGTAVYTKNLAPNADETLAIPVVNFSAGDVITLVFGFANYHSNINMKLTGDTFTVQGSATVSGISNTTNTSTTIEVST